MKVHPIFLIITLIMTLNASLIAQVHTRIDGNGTIQTKTIAIQDFEHFQINTPARVLIEVGKPASLRITLDENIFERVYITDKAGKLHISPDGWIEPTRFEIHVSVPNLRQVTTSGYGDYTIEGLQGEYLAIENGVGNMTISGKVQQLIVQSKKGEIDASNLVAQEAKVFLRSWTTVFVDVRKKLEAYPGKHGKIIYKQQPEELISQLPAPKQLLTKAQYEALPTPPPVQYVSLKLHNNRLAYTAIRIEGPEHRPFGYGTSIFPFFKRKERFPVGTKIYQELKNGQEKLLVEISSEDDDKTVKLF